MAAVTPATVSVVNSIHTITIDPQALEYSVEGSDVVGSCPQVKAQTMFGSVLTIGCFDGVDNTKFKA